MPDLTQLAELMERFEGSALAIHPERCVSVRNRNAACTRCQEACPVEAISCTDNTLDIDKDLCIGCAACATVCPTAALLPVNPTFAELIEGSVAVARDNGGRLIVACRDYLKENNHFDSTQVYEVDCFARLDEAYLIGLVAYGVEQVTLVDGRCPTCAYAQITKTVDHVIDTASTLLAAWGRDLPLTRVDTMPEIAVSRHKAKAQRTDRGLSRRDFFTDIKGNAKVLAADVVLEAMSDGSDGDDATTKSLTELLRVPRGGTMSQFAPKRNELILGFLDQMGQPIDETVCCDLWAKVQVDPRTCTLCGMCGVFCPTGAIVKCGTSTNPGLELYPVDCVACDLCLTACLPHAITLSHGIVLTQLLNCESEHVAVERGGPRTPVRSTKIAMPKTNR